ncbi:MAG: hypothetical protein H6581_27595 [Bacteroidia bacterium]|nr:hypothetical protein [Bacteroidia bacterium]
MKCIKITLLTLLSAFLFQGIQAQSMQLMDIFKPSMGKTFRGLDLGMNFTDVNNVTGIPRNQLYSSPNVPFSYPINEYGKPGDQMQGFLSFTREETLKQIEVNLTFMDPLNFSDMEIEIREYLDQKYGSYAMEGVDKTWREGALSILMRSEETGTGGMVFLKFEFTGVRR